MKSKRRKQPVITVRPGAPKLDKTRRDAASMTVESAGTIPWWWHAVVLLALLLVNQALYHRTLGVGFLSVDDGDYVQNNPYIGSLRAATLKPIFTTAYFANYAPANLLSYALDVALAGGRSDCAFHLSNVLWHGAVVGLVYLLAFTIRAEVFPAAAAALLFLLHPAHVEVVAWISSRKDLVATAFGVLSMICYLRYRRTRPAGRSHRSAGWYAASLLSFVAASAGKQSVLLLPLVMIAWDIFVERRHSWKLLADKIPFGFVALFFGWMTWQAQPGTGQTVQPFVLAATQFTNLWLLTGLGQYVLYRPAPNPADWSATARLALIAAAVLVWVLPLLSLRSKSSIKDSLLPSLVLWYWVLIQMVPPMLLSFIVPITDRYLFLPSVGFCILLAIAASTFGRKWFSARGGISRKQKATIHLRNYSLWILLAGVGALWAIKTSAYIAEWRDPRTVWYGAHFKTKDAQVAQFLGQVYQDNGERVDDFIKSGAMPDMTNQLQLAAAVLNDAQRTENLRAEWLGLSPGRTNSATYRDRLWDLAWEQFEASVQRRGMLSTPNLFMCRGRLLVREGKFERAIPEFANALRLAETSHYQRVRFEGVTHALYAIGVAYWDLGNYREAQRWLLQAQTTQRSSGQIWIGSLDKDVEHIQALAAGR